MVIDKSFLIARNCKKPMKHRIQKTDGKRQEVQKKEWYSSVPNSSDGLIFLLRRSGRAPMVQPYDVLSGEPVLRWPTGYTAVHWYRFSIRRRNPDLMRMQ